MLDSAGAEKLRVLNLAAHELSGIEGVQARGFIIRTLQVVVVVFLKLLVARNEAALQVLGHIAAETSPVLVSHVALVAARNRERQELALRPEPVDLVDPTRIIGAKPRPDAERLMEVDTFALFKFERGCGLSGAVDSGKRVEVDLGIGNRVCFHDVRVRTK